MKPRIYADLNKLDEYRRAILICVGTKEDISRLGLTLSEGMSVTLYMPERFDEHGNLECLEVDAVVKFDAKNDWWVGEFDWDSLGLQTTKP